MQLIDYYQLTLSQKEEFVAFLKEASKEILQPAHENMWDNDWQNKNNTLLYLLENTNRFSEQGMYNVLFDDGKAVACSGVYASAFCPELAIAGTRTWIKKNYRNLAVAREYLLPYEKAWAVKNNFKAIAVCFNDYNRNMLKLWNRIRLGENRSDRQAHHIFYNGANEVAFPVNVQYTKQWIMYEKLDPLFEFDWNTIK